MTGSERGGDSRLRERPPWLSGASAARRPDASMSLLADIAAHSVEDGYVDAAARRHVDGGPGSARGTLGGIGLVVVVVVLGLLLTAAVVTIRSRSDVPGARAQLMAEVEDRVAGAGELESGVLVLRETVRALQNDGLALTSTGVATAARLEQLAVLVGDVPVTGPGLQVTVSDAPKTGTSPAEARPQGSVDASRVTDTDLQIAVNGLWEAGAEAVAVNGQRLTALTSVRAAGAAILVDYQPLEQPYVLSAVGDPEQLEVGFVSGLGGRWLRSAADNYGIELSVGTSEDLVLPAAATIGLRHAGPVTSAVSAPDAGEDLPQGRADEPDTVGAPT